MVFWKTIGTCFGLGVVFLFILWITLPNIDDPETLFAAESSVIVDRNNVELYRLFSDVDRTYVPRANISDFVEQATIAIEDERFFDRGCFDVIGFMRAAVSQFIPGFVKSGGSTLTQQFAGNAMVGRQRSIIRKAREYMLACQLENRYSKEQLLELYLNWIPFGETSYGIEQASLNYFGVSASGITLPQAAALAGLVQRPSYFSPYGAHARTTVSEDIMQRILTKEITSIDQIPSDDIQIGLLGQNVGTGATFVYIGGRADQVLKNMENLDMITTAQYEQAIRDLQTLTFTRARSSIRAPHFVLWVKDQAAELLKLEDEGVFEQGGFSIRTTLDWKLQEAAEKEVKKQKDDFLNRFNARNAALLSLDPKTNEILAYVGNIDFEDETAEGKIDMVQAPRQPGSSFKPFIYAAAYEKGFGPASVIYDVPTKFGEDTPQNFEGGFFGLMSMRTALAQSRNIPAAKAFFLAGGEDSVLSFVDRLGVKTPTIEKQEYLRQNSQFQYGWPLAIGSAEVPLMEMATGYSVFADAGKLKPVVSILEIRDRQGNILYTHKPETPQEVLDPRIAAQITSVLSDNDARPANEYWRNQLTVPGFQAAAKTGTSNKCLERKGDADCTLRRPESNWTMGYTPELLTGVWVGNANSESLSDRADGLTTAGTIWHNYMAAAHKVLPVTATQFSLPSGIVQPQISMLSGKLPSDCTPVHLRRSDLFLQERVPTESDPACAILTVDKVTGLLSSPACPKDAEEQGAFFIPTSEQPERWFTWEQGVQGWAKEQMVKWKANETHSGSQLPLALAPTEQCDPALTPGRGEKPIVQIISPSNDDRVGEYPVFEVEIDISAMSQIKEIRFEVDGRPIRTETTVPSGSISLRVPRTIEENGEHELKVTIVNEYFTEASDTVRFRFGSGE